MTPKFILIATPPRCGSMWLYNAARLTLRSAGLTAKPEYIVSDRAEIAALARAAAADPDRRAVFTAKTHEAFAIADAPAFALTVLRDPRDMVVSYRAFPGAAERDRPIAALVGAMIAMYDATAAVWGDALFEARYDDLVARPAAVCADLRAALGLPPAPIRDAEIAQALRPENVREIIARAEAGEGALPEQADAAARGAHDRRTGFQTGHIADRATGKWRAALSAEDQAAIADAHGAWLRARNFPLA